MIHCAVRAKTAPLVENGMELRDAAFGTEEVLQLVHVLLKQPLAGNDGGRAVCAAAPLVLLALGIVAGLAVLGALFAIGRCSSEGSRVRAVGFAS